MYAFATFQYREFAKRMEKVVPINWRQNDGIEANAKMWFDESSHSVVIEYKSGADEVIDILHELLHVEMFFEGGFRQLAWGSPPPVSVQRLVYHIRNIVDDIYVFTVLSDRFGSFSLSPNFFAECKNDNRKQRICLADNESDPHCQIAVAAWRIRMAEMAANEYADKLKPNQKKIVAQFLEAFKSPPVDVADLLKLIRKCAKPSDVSDVTRHSKASIAIRDHFGVPENVLHLAAFQKKADVYVLRRICC